MEKNLKRTSKFLSLILRHNPEKVGIKLDANGWVLVDVLITALNQNGHSVDRKLLDNVVADNDKNRFSFSDDGSKIRANQGHSVDVDLQLKPQEPPAVLFHGTVDKFLDSIQSNGLIPGSRQHVHLSQDLKTATNVGSRRGKPVILEVRAQQMHEDGLPFYRSQNGVWLTDHVPPKYLEFPS